MLAAKAKLSALGAAALRGEDVYLCRAGKPVVRLVPVEHAQQPEPDPCRATPSLTVRGSDQDIEAPLDPEDWGPIA
jgi:antitoxin (DNA-binding transcriptional repressor) of toxin-antitoxin stability system